MEPGQLTAPLAPAARGRRERGFTLIEILVVVVIIGLVAAGAVLSLNLGGKDRQLEQERDRIAALMDYARERGGTLSIEYGIRCGLHGYRFIYFDTRAQRWLPEINDEALAVRKLPAGLALRLVIEGREIVLEDKALQVDPRLALALRNPQLTMNTSTLGGGVGALGTAGAGGGTLGNAGTSLGSALGGASGTTLGSAGSPISGATGNGSGSVLGTGNASGTADSGLLSGASDDSPQILLMSNGDTNSFELTLAREAGARVTIQSSADGTIKVGEPQAPTP